MRNHADEVRVSLCRIPHSTSYPWHTGPLHPSHDLIPPVAGEHPDPAPSEAIDVLGTHDVAAELHRVSPVLLAVVLGRHHELFPTHVEVVPRVAVRGVDRDLSLGLREASLDQQLQVIYPTLLPQEPQLVPPAVA